jgi:hypothetical protein
MTTVLQLHASPRLVEATSKHKNSLLSTQHSVRHTNKYLQRESKETLRIAILAGR